MTEAISGSGQSPAAALMSAVSSKGRDGERAQGKGASKGAQSDDDALQDASGALAKSTQAGDTPSVKDAQKPVRKASNGDGKKDDKDASFEATIDSIDHADDSGKQTAASQQAALWNAAALAQAPAVQDKDASTGQSGEANAPSNTSAAQTPQLLKQERISALLLARQRLLAGDASEMAAAGGAVSKEVVTVPVTVTSRETHWSFVDTVTSDTLQKAAMASAKNVQNASATASAASDATPAKGDGTTKAADSLRQVTPQLAQSESAGSNTGQQSSGDNRDAAAGSRDNRTAASVKAREGGETTASKFADRVATDDKQSTNTISSPMQQVRNSLLDALKGDPLQTMRANTVPGLQSRLVNPGNVIRTIELTLSPADLGSVSLRLSLRSNVLTIEAEAAKASTAKLLNDDRSVLEQNLKNAGYEISSLKITDGGSNANAALTALTTMTAGAATAPSHAGGASFQDNGQQRFGFAQNQGGEMQRRDGSTHDRSQQRSRPATPQTSSATDAGGLRQANAIYI